MKKYFLVLGMVFFFSVSAVEAQSIKSLVCELEELVLVEIAKEDTVEYNLLLSPYSVFYKTETLKFYKGSVNKNINSWEIGFPKIGYGLFEIRDDNWNIASYPGWVVRKNPKKVLRKELKAALKTLNRQ